MIHRTMWQAALVVTAALVVSACGGNGEPGAESRPDPTGDWVLIEGRGPDSELALVDGSPVTLSIDADRWGGVAACNSYGGSVSIDGDRLTIDDGFVVTEMACPDEDAMALEAGYLAALRAVERVALRDEQLVLTGPDAELVFDRLPPETDAALVGTVWRLESLVDGLGPDGSVSSVVGEPTLELSQDGEVLGDTGCNSFSGSYQLDGTALRLGPLAVTEMACDGLEGAQEEHVLGVLGSDELEVTVEGATLRLTGGEQALEYRAD